MDKLTDEEQLRSGMMLETVHFNKTEAICPGKICVGDLSILAMYMCSQYFKNEDDFKTLIPSAVPMIKKLMTNQKIAQWVKSKESVPFTPY